MPLSGVLVEVFCGSVDDCVAAEEGGADRIELNSALFLGGLTPTVGTLAEAKKRVDIPVMAMVRPRAGGFHYTETEMAVMERDARLLLDHGADGIVFGVLREDGTVDEARCQRLLAAAEGKETMFHRAFDVVPDPFAAVDTLVKLGFDRILTKGRDNEVEASLSLLRELIEYAAGRIELVLGGIRPYNVQRVVEATGGREIHVSAFESRIDLSTAAGPHVRFGGTLHPAENRYDVVSGEGVRRLRSAVEGL